MNAKKSLLIGAVVASIGVGGIGTAGLASAETTDDSNTGSTIVDRLTERFNLNKDEVNAVFEAQRSERHTAMAADRNEGVTAAVEAGTITQEQADYILATLKEVDALRADMTPGEPNDEVRDQVREKMSELRDWANENDIELHEIDGFGGHGKGRGGHGGEHGPRGQFGN